MRNQSHTVFDGKFRRNFIVTGEHVQAVLLRVV